MFPWDVTTGVPPNFSKTGNSQDSSTGDVTRDMEDKYVLKC